MVQLGKIIGITLLLALAGCRPGDLAAPVQAENNERSDSTLVLAALNWPEARFFNAYFGFILHEGFGYQIQLKEGSEASLFKALKRQQIDLQLVVWKQGYLNFEKAVADRRLMELGELYSSARQGYYVPSYMINGDASRGIEAMAPELKTVADLARYPELFSSADGQPGTFIGAPRGWWAAQATSAKFKLYGLDKGFSLKRPHSARELEQSLLAAYEQGLPWVGYYWEPGWIWGKHDLTLLQEPAFDSRRYQKDFGTAFPLAQVVIAGQSGLMEKAPDIVSFLQQYQTDVAWVSDVLGELHDSELGVEELAREKLREHPELWLSLVPEAVGLKVLAALKREE